MFSILNNSETILDAPLVRDNRVTSLTKSAGLIEFMQSIIFERKEEIDEPFYVLDLGVIASLYKKWKNSFPTIHPYYAVKCNSNTALLGALAALGSNFDCASRAEIEAVLALGVSPDRIIYANPCKQVSHIKYAASVGVNLTTFDSMEELDKIRKWHPQCALLLRIKAPDDSKAKYEQHFKFGARPEEVEPLLRSAQASGLKVLGVSFHIGTGATNFHAFRGAIAEAKIVFDTAAQLGINEMHVVDIGGGFGSNPKFQEAASIIKDALQSYFPNEPGLTVISEPGRFFPTSAFTLATKIIGKRVRDEVREYWINDGIYGSMNCIIFDHANLTCMPLACASNCENPTCKWLTTYTSMFGPTMDALDTIFTGYLLPELQVGDWLVFPTMGAYTTVCGTNFNGFNTAAIPTYLVYANTSHSCM
ncbi:Ornithine decarboxylase [Melia azedarach]|uniref:Ornithine decarboxylase n=1 Tax=Melia azedarach TaxID=155640 RepID=A0ACC1WTA1_MELAZ|nr:Ornithine decarboxylase [Melia azedarach]